jgi:arylsulfatase
LIDLPLTILELAGGKWPKAFPGMPMPPPPGRSLVPAFAKDGTVRRECLWWFHDGNRALRAGDWKLVSDHQNPWELYNLRTDRAESRNLAIKNPGKVRELERIWTRHLQEFRALASQPLPRKDAKRVKEGED